MNDTATAGGASGASLIPSTTDAFTIAHLAIVAIFALAVIAAIVWGARLKRRRKNAERDIAQHNVEVEQAAPTPAPAPPPAPVAAPVRPPVAAPTAPTWEVTPVPAPPADPEPLADEPIAASGPLEAAPAAEAASRASAGEPVAPEPAMAPVPAEEPAPPVARAPEPAPVPPATSPADAPVSTLKGLGPKLAARLGELGVSTVGQVAALTDDEAARLDAQLGPFSGRMTRDRWIEQARFLAAGDTAGFEAVFGRL